MYKQDIDKLKDFVNSVKGDIDLIVSHLYEITTEEKIRNLSIEKAWEDIKPRFEEIVQTLEGEGLLSNKKIEEELANKGLVGSQLDLKLKLYQLCRQEFRKELNSFAENASEEKRVILRKILGRLFQITNRIFKNLGFIPGSDAIKELKSVLEEVIQYPTAISFSKAKNQKLFHRIMNFSNALRALVINISILVLVPFFIYVIYAELKRDVVLINDFEVCQGLQKIGYNGKIITNKLMDEIIYIKTTAATSMKCRDFMCAWLQPTPSIEIPGTGFSLLPTLQYIKELFGAHKSNIFGELSLRNNQVYMTVRVSGKPGNTIKCEMKNLENALRQQAENIYGYIQPFILAAYFYSIGKKQDSIEVIQRLTLRQPPFDDDPWAYNLWGIILMEQKEYGLAIAKFQKAIHLNPAFAIAYNSWGMVYTEQRLCKEGIEKFQEAIRINPKFVIPHINLATAFIMNKEYTHAITKCQDAIELDPKDPRPYFNWGRALAGDKKYDQAIAKYQEAIEIDPKYSKAYNNRGAVYIKLGQYEKAILDYKKAIELQPKEPVFFLNLSEAYIISGKYENALSNIKQSFSLISKAEDKVINLYLETISKKLLNIDTTDSESALGVMLKQRVTADWSFNEIESWIKSANVSENIKQYILEKTNLVKKIVNPDRAE